MRFDPEGELITGSEMSFLHPLRELVETLHLAAARKGLLTREGGEMGEEGRGASRIGGKVGSC